jgi:hypothetical protein
MWSDRGSRLDNGKTYDINDGSLIADFPVWLPPAV